MNLQTVEKVLSLAGFDGTSPAEQWNAERQKIRDFANLGDGWDGSGKAKPPSSDIIERTIQVLDKLQYHRIVCPTAIPYPGRVIGLMWGHDDVWLEVGMDAIELSFFANVEGD